VHGRLPKQGKNRDFPSTGLEAHIVHTNYIIRAI